MTYEEFKFLKAVLIKKGSAEARVITDSMEPCIVVGEEISLIPISDNLKPFDIISFWDGEKITCHFFWKKSLLKEGQFLTKSLKDKDDFDLPFEGKDILGKVTSHRLSLWQKTKIVLSQFFN